MQLTSEFKVNFTLGNINVFRNTVHGAAKFQLPNQLNKINAYLEENFKDKSTTLDLFVEKTKKANDQLLAKIQEIIQEYYDVIDKNVEVLKAMEETSVKDINEKL